MSSLRSKINLLERTKLNQKNHVDLRIKKSKVQKKQVVQPPHAILFHQSQFSKQWKRYQDKYQRNTLWLQSR